MGELLQFFEYQIHCNGFCTSQAHTNSIFEQFHLFSLESRGWASLGRVGVFGQATSKLGLSRYFINERVFCALCSRSDEGHVTMLKSLSRRLLLSIYSQLGCQSQFVYWLASVCFQL